MANKAPSKHYRKGVSPCQILKMYPDAKIDYEEPS